MSVARIRKSPYYRGLFLKENVTILSGHWKLSVI